MYLYDVLWLFTHIIMSIVYVMFQIVYCWTCIYTLVLCDVSRYCYLLIVCLFRKYMCIYIYILESVFIIHLFLFHLFLYLICPWYLPVLYYSIESSLRSHQQDVREENSFTCSILCYIFVVTSTLPETNIAPKNGWLEYYFPIGETYFQVLC